MPAGRPRHFDNEKELEEAIAGYFEYIKGETKEVDEPIPPRPGGSQTGDPKTRKVIIPVREPEVSTITGLALYIGFESRQSFYDYEKNGEFSYCIKRARLRIETEYEKRLQGNNPAGAIFALKNFGWSDKQEIDQKTEHSGTIGFTGINIIKPNEPTGD